VSSPSYQTGPGGLATRPSVAAGTLWAGGFATAVVAALAYAVGVVITRVLFDVPVLAPERDGALGDATTWQLALVAFGAALLATALMHMLLVVTPRPYSFFIWIMVLATALVTVLPFAQDAPTSSKIATAIINLVVGIAITSLIRSVAARAVRPARRPAPYGGPSDMGPGPQTRGYGYPPAGGYPDSQPDDPYGPR
jgi:Family of unknown function (DUF6069)